MARGGRISGVPNRGNSLQSIARYIMHTLCDQFMKPVIPNAAWLGLWFFNPLVTVKQDSNTTGSVLDHAFSGSIMVSSCVAM